MATTFVVVRCCYCAGNDGSRREKKKKRDARKESRADSLVLLDFVLVIFRFEKERNRPQKNGTVF